MDKKQGIARVMLPISLLCAFALTAALTVALGAEVFAGVTGRLEENFALRTALSYVSEKNRQCTGMSVDSVDGSPALVFDTTLGSTECRTWIYHTGGRLYEVTLAADTAAKLGDGQAVLELDGFTAEAADGVVTITVTDGGAEACTTLAGGAE